jgi:hypothetical protein
MYANEDGTELLLLLLLLLWPISMLQLLLEVLSCTSCI